jgi:hypothetical protein
MTVKKHIGRAAVALALVVAALAPAVPAHAEVTPAACTQDGHRLDAWAYFHPDGPNHHWDEFVYILSGHETGGKSNVNLELFVDFRSNVVYWNHSADDLDNDVYYSVVPPWDVFTPADSLEMVAYKAIFDERYRPDPSCPALSWSV